MIIYPWSIISDPKLAQLTHDQVQEAVAFMYVCVCVCVCARVHMCVCACVGSHSNAWQLNFN